LKDQYAQYGKAKPNVITDSTSKPNDIIKYSPKPPVKITLFPSISSFVKKYLNDQNTKYGKAKPRVITDNTSNPNDIIKYSPKLPVNVTVLLIILILNNNSL
tara:strand:+ start:245 stop:550 length:306 start_codon:yes stop_codon:yes gene_type:complete